MIVPNALDWSGRSGRLPFIVAAIGTVVLALSLASVAKFSIGYSAIVIALALAWLVFMGQMRRRLRDLDLSGWMMWLILVPLVNTVFVLFLAIKGGAASAKQSTGYSRVGFALVCGFCLLILSRLFWAPYWIPSGLMKPTLLVGDFLAVTRAAQVKRGDVVVFRHPVNEQDYINRIVGMPGETVQMVQGVLQINGQAVAMQQDGVFQEVMALQGPSGQLPRCANSPVSIGGACEKPRWIETLTEAAASHEIVGIGETNADNTGRFEVPVGHYFVMGDNRDNSLDSRFPRQAGGIGYVPSENVVGRAKWILFSSAGRAMWQFWTWRGDRFVKGVQ